jgi:hypothetical protein
MNEIRYYYYKQIKKLKEEAEMESEQRTIKEDAPLTDMEYHKVLASDLNLVLATLKHYLREDNGLYDGNGQKELQDSINNIQDYKNKLISQYIK